MTSSSCPLQDCTYIAHILSLLDKEDMQRVKRTSRALYNIVTANMRPSVDIVLMDYSTVFGKSCGVSMAFYKCHSEKKISEVHFHPKKVVFFKWNSLNVRQFRELKLLRYTDAVGNVKQFLRQHRHRINIRNVECEISSETNRMSSVMDLLNPKGDTTESFVSYNERQRDSLGPLFVLDSDFYDSLDVFNLKFHRTECIVKGASTLSLEPIRNLIKQWVNGKRDVFQLNVRFVAEKPSMQAVEEMLNEFTYEKERNDNISPISAQISSMNLKRHICFKVTNAFGCTISLGREIVNDSTLLRYMENDTYDKELLPHPFVHKFQLSCDLENESPGLKPVRQILKDWVSGQLTSFQTNIEYVANTPSLSSIELLLREFDVSYTGEENTLDSTNRAIVKRSDTSTLQMTVITDPTFTVIINFY